MDWVFIVFALGAAAYTFSIVKEFLSEVRLQDIKLNHSKMEKAELDLKMEQNNKEKEDITLQIEVAKQAVKELQETASLRSAKIKKYEAEMAKKGKYKL